MSTANVTFTNSATSARESQRHVHRAMNSLRVPQKKIARDKEAIDRCREYKMNSMDAFTDNFCPSVGSRKF